MRFSCKMYDTINVLILHQLVEGIKVTDVQFDKLVVGLVLNILEVCQVASIRELVEVDDVVLGVLVYKEANYMRADEACATGYYNISFTHDSIFIKNL